MSTNASSTIRQRRVVDDVNGLKDEGFSSSNHSTTVPTMSTSSSSASVSSLLTSKDDINAVAVMTKKENKKVFKSLKERNKPPASFYLSFILVISLQYFSGLYSNVQLIIESLRHSVSFALNTIVHLLQYVQSLLSLSKNNVDEHTIQEYITCFTLVAIISCIFYVLIYAPLKDGMWTQQPRVKKHKVHRYFGLSFLTLYTLAWVEFLCGYDESYQFSFLPHLIALNGLIQVHSAFFSFKVLPASEDAGYYSDVAVLSRTFVHENSFFQLMSLFGSIYYGPMTLATTNHFVSTSLSSSIVSNVICKITEYAFIFYPYVLVRTWFPRTKFQSSTRTKEQNERFYRFGALAIKIFYLWAKYFLGFYINFLVFLNNKTQMNGTNSILSSDDMKFIRGLFLLNVGTISISVFLHTLRFKKVLPPRLTFSLYLVQIYLTFLAVPYLGHLFLQHLELACLVLVGMASNMTRSRKIHALWCVLCHYLLVHSNIDW